MLTSLRNNWNALSPLQRAALAGLLAVVFGGILMLAVVSGRPTYAVLYTDMAPEDAGTIQTKLRDLKVDFRLTGEGRTIEVPADRVYDLRNSLATEGLPRKGTVGMEILDKPNFGTTDWKEHVNYQRALEGELTRTIQDLNGIAEARVHLAIPEKEVFVATPKLVTASVVLHLQPGYRPGERQVAGIVHLVSSAVERLQPENVRVIDERGNLLSTNGDSSQLSGSQIEFQEHFETRLTDDLQQLTDRVLGPNKAAIRVSAELDWDQTQTSKETFQPGGPRGANLPTQERMVSENYIKEQGGTSVPGTVTNALVNNNIKAGEYVKSQKEQQYALNKVTEKRVTAPGKIRRLSVAVILDAQISPAEQQALRNTLAAGAGLDLTPTSAGGRGDKIELTAIPFDRAAELKVAKDAEADLKKQTQFTLMRNGAAALIIALVAGFTLLMLRKPKPRREPKGRREALPQIDATVGTSDETPPALMGDEAQSVTETGEFDDEGLEAEEIETPLDRIRLVAANQPEDIAAMLQGWLREQPETVDARTIRN